MSNGSALEVLTKPRQRLEEHEVASEHEESEMDVATPLVPDT